ncbi:interleukin-17F [Trichechus manatus latirostris]|uniref:Interleukin-17F n=1 Tax=Trichechus manatus latirostris TaxID=127582 RepID=A0A2Y9E868_TRIMA|nr:interleukin-17F [Trichechus manatus latirostris]
MAILRDTEVVKSLLLLMLGLTLLKTEAALKIPKAGVIALRTPENCPSLEDSTVALDIRILNKNQGGHTLPNINNRSTSPWDYNIMRDMNRFPSSIAEARCRSFSCIDADGKPNNFMNSVPIHQEILVLRREPQGCLPLRLEKIRVTVGCTCVTPLVHHSD